MIKLKSNIQESSKVKNFIGVYCEWDHGAKGMYAGIIMEKDVKKLVDGYKKSIGSDVNFQKTPRAPCTTLSKSDLE